MKSKERYRPRKFGYDAAKGAIVDTGNPWQNLANGIVQQAAEDYRAALRYMREHPNPVRIDAFLSEEEINALQERVSRSKDELHRIRCTKPEYRDEVLWEVAYRAHWTQERQKRIRSTKAYQNYLRAEKRWVDSDSMLIDCEDFFQGDWIRMLTKLDGPMLMNQIALDLDGTKRNLDVPIREDVDDVELF